MGVYHISSLCLPSRIVSDARLSSAPASIEPLTSTELRGQTPPAISPADSDEQAEVRTGLLAAGTSSYGGVFEPLGNRHSVCGFDDTRPDRRTTGLRIAVGYQIAIFDEVAAYSRNWLPFRTFQALVDHSGNDEPNDAGPKARQLFEQSELRRGLPGVGTAVDAEATLGPHYGAAECVEIGLVGHRLCEERPIVCRASRYCVDEKGL